jgi:hypothetical protein
MTTWTTAEFQLDWLPGQVFTGYTDGSDWNGFERPYFDYTTAEALLRSCEPQGYNWRYDASEDIFIVSSPDQREEGVEMFRGETLPVAGASLQLYPIGAGSWIWGQADE